MSENSISQRPKNLNILNILSFVGIGLFIILGAILVVWGIGSKAMFENPEMLKEAQNMIMQNDLLDDDAKNAQLAALLGTRHFFISGMAILITQLICLFGVLRMRKLKKTGFAIYSIGELGLPLALIVLLGSSAILGFIVPIAMVILYGTQLKEMHL